MFDWQTALKFTQGGNILGGVGKGLGLPDCIVNLGTAALSLLPASVLNQWNFASQEGQAQFDAWISKHTDELANQFGIDITVTPNGEISIINRNAKVNSGLLGGLGAAAGFAAGAAQFGAGLYAQGM